MAPGSFANSSSDGEPSRPKSFFNSPRAFRYPETSGRLMSNLASFTCSTDTVTSARPRLSAAWICFFTVISRLASSCGIRVCTSKNRLLTVRMSTRTLKPSPSALPCPNPVILLIIGPRCGASILLALLFPRLCRSPPACSLAKASVSILLRLPQRLLLRADQASPCQGLGQLEACPASHFFRHRFRTGRKLIAKLKLIQV